MVAAVAVAFSTVIFGLARRAPITADNVNDEWVGGLQPVEPTAAVAVTAKAA